MAQPTRPNILWICTDQQRYDTLGVYGNPFVRTPRLDRLAADGVLFESCYSQSPVCTPSRAAFLTGRYPRTTRCRQNGQSIPADEVLVTRLLADAGYVGGLSGKLHLSVCHPSACPGTEARIADGYSAFHWSHAPAPDTPTNEYLHWLREQGVTHATPPLPGSRYVRQGMPAHLHQTTWCAQKAITFMQTNAGRAHPWFFSVNMYDPHHPFDPPQDYLQRYLERLDDIPLPSYTPGELDGKPALQRAYHHAAYNTPGLFPFTDMSAADHRLLRAAYWAMVDLIDDQVGRMMEALRASGQLENTMVIFTSDHGEMLGDHGIYLKGPFFYEPAIRVPLIVSWPGMFAGGRRIPAPVELMDLAPTILEAAGLEPPPGMQARSLLPLLTAQPGARPQRDDVYCEYYNAMPWDKNPLAYATMVRTPRWKVVAIHGTDEGELYDMEQDADEKANLWDDPACVSVKAAMLKRLCDRLAWTVDPLPVRQGPW